jgi:hypothetical protein
MWQTVACWIKSHEALAIWIEGIALVLIFALDATVFVLGLFDKRKQHAESVAQMEIMQKQARATETAAEAATKSVESLISKDRARIEIIAGKVQVASGSAIGITCFLNNVGPTPAFIEDGGILLLQGAKDVEVDYDKCVKIPFVGNIPANSRTPTQFGVPLQSKPILTDDEAVAIRQGNSFVHFYGYVRYRDVFDRLRRVQVHLRWFMRWGGMMKGQVMEWWEPVGEPEDNKDA